MCSQILVVMVLLTRVIGWAPALCGLLSTIMFIPITFFLGKKLASIRKQLMLQTDARIKLCTEIVTGNLSHSPYNLTVPEQRSEVAHVQEWFSLPLGLLGSTLIQQSQIMFGNSFTCNQERDLYG